MVIVVLRMSVLKTVEYVFGSVAGPGHACPDYFLGDSLQIVGLSDVGHGFDEDRGQVDFPAKFGGAVVPGEGVVIVVEA